MVVIVEGIVRYEVRDWIPSCSVGRDSLMSVMEQFKGKDVKITIEEKDSG